MLWRACNLTAFIHWYTVPLVQWSTRLLPIMRDPGSIPRGVFMWNWDTLLALSRYIGDSDVIDHCGLVWGELCPEPLQGRCANNVITPLDLTQLFCHNSTLAAGPSSGFTTNIVGCWGEPCGEPAISLHSYTNTQFHWSSSPPVCFPSWGIRVQSPGGYLCETGILLLAVSATVRAGIVLPS